MLCPMARVPKVDIRSPRQEAGARIGGMERKSVILPIVLMALSAIGVGLQAAEEQNAKYTVRILALPDHGHAHYRTTVVQRL